MTQETLNKRTQPRNRCLREGKIIFSNGNFVVDCTIDNLSVTGAHIRVLASTPIPKEFLLVEPGRSVVHRAVIVRRTARGLGVKFNGVLDDPQARDLYLRKFKR